MFIKNNGQKLKINPDGSITIGDKVYYDINSNLKNLTLDPLLNNEQSIEYRNIPIGIRKRINKSLNEIFDNLEASDDSIVALNHFKKFGLISETKSILRESSKKINASLFKMGFSNLDKFYFDNKKAKLEFIKTLDVNDKVNHEAIAKYVLYYKENNINNYRVFNETLQDFGIKNQSDILRYYNDSIDSSFKLSSEEFGIISFAKRDLINLQNKIIQDAISLGLDIPADLPRFVAPSDKIKDETINPAKIKLIQTLELIENSNYKSNYFNSDHSVSLELKEKFIKELKTQEKIINIDTNDNLELIKLQVLNNNGFSFQRMKNWALNNKLEILGPQKSMIIAQTGLKYCNKLVECGILKTSNFEDYTFSCPRAREILLENSDKSFNELADLMINEFKAITEIKENEHFETINDEVVKKEKKDFFDFLDAQYNSFYKTQNIDFETFKNDILKDNSQELNRINDLYPALKTISASDLIKEYEDKKIYTYDRTNTLTFNSKKEKDALNKLWKETQDTNRSKSEEDIKAPIEFINVSAVKFEGINLHKLNEWKNNVTLPGDQAEKFVELSIKHAKDLVNIGILKTNDNEIFSFTDNFAKETLFKNYDKSLDELEILNLGTKKLREEFNKINSIEKNGKDVTKQDIDSKKITEVVVVADEEQSISVPENDKEVISSTNHSLEDNELITKFLTFNHFYDQSSNEKYISLMRTEENKLNNELENKCILDSNFREELKLLSKSETIDSNKYFHLTNLLDSLDNKYLDSLESNEKKLELN